MSVNVQLEPEAQKFVKAITNSPYLFNLGPEKGRSVVDKVQSNPVSKLAFEIENRMIAGIPGGQVDVRIFFDRTFWLSFSHSNSRRTEQSYATRD